MDVLARWDTEAQDSGHVLTEIASGHPQAHKTDALAVWHVSPPRAL
jgi:hypothetical protein